MSKDYGQECPLAKTAEIVAERWTPLILRQLFAGRTRFNQFIEDLPGISPRILADRLKRLECEGIIARRVISDYPPRVDYILTAEGQALHVLVLAMAEWGMRRCPDKGRGTVELIHQTCGGAARIDVSCENCGEGISPDDVVLRVQHHSAAVGSVPPTSAKVADHR